MKRLLNCAVALYGIVCGSVSADPPAWLDDWYEIEVIVFIQPDSSSQESESSTPSIYTEDLIVAAPEAIEEVTHVFPLTEAERAHLNRNSVAVDLNTGADSWFIPREMLIGEQPNSRSDSEISSYGEFPEWILPPGESYDPLFASAFSDVPFGDWFAILSLASLIEKEDEEETEDPQTGDTIDGDELPSIGESTGERETPREEIVAQIEGFRDALELSSYIMDEQDVRLPRTAERLRSKGVHVVKHFNWHQYVPPLSAEPEYVFFQSLKEYPTEGYFGVSKGRFIHFEVHLWIHQMTGTIDIRFPVYELKELRRMQREDVHYFDHPKFGILAEVVKIELPPDLQALWDSLD